MGGKNKNKRKYQQPNNRNNSQATVKVTEQELCELVTEATNLHVLLNARHEKLKEEKEFAHILSTKWLRQWKDYVGYDNLFCDDEQKGNKKMGKRRPGPPNTDLLGSTKQFFPIPEELDEYSYLGKVISQKLTFNEDYIAITTQLWKSFDQIYGPGQQIIRPLRILKSGRVQVDGSLMKCDFLFINYMQQNLLQAIETSKTVKNVQNYLPFNSLQFSQIWNLQQLYDFIGKYCECEYGSMKVTLWLCYNFLGSKTIQQNIFQSIKDKSYELDAYKVNINYLQDRDLDLQDFLKPQYTIVVEVGDSKFDEGKLPEDIFGYCEECLEKRALKFHCLCNRMHYCSKECKCDDQVWHFRSCLESFESDDDKEYSKKKGAKSSICGLKNLGNTCYMNSSLQLFQNLDFLIQFIVTAEIPKIVSSDEETNSMFLQKLSKHCKMMGEHKKQQSLVPWSIKGQVNYFMPAFSGYKQHDAIDFLTGFLNTLNECLAKEKDSAYHHIFLSNLMGRFDSLVICPNCANQVKNKEDFMQITLPIKTKTMKSLYTYVVMESPLVYRYGQAEVKKTWEEMRESVGVPGDCLVMAGKDGEDLLTPINFEEQTEKTIKKIKKDIIYMANQKQKEGDLCIDTSLIIMKKVCGESMKATIGYPFPTIIQSYKSMGHFFIALIKQLRSDCNKQMLNQLQQQYHKIIEQSFQGKIEKKQGEQQSSKQQTQKQEQGTIGEMQKLNAQVKGVMEELRMKVFIEDVKKIKNVCFYCHQHRCKGCELLPSFETTAGQFFSHKARETKVTVLFEQKLEIVKEQKDLANNGGTTLQDCLTLFSEPEQLDAENAWYCSSCEELQLAYKQMHIEKYPKYLIIQLSRFKNGANGKVKNNEAVSYNEYQEFGGQQYRLVSAIIHQGSIDGGHYWAIGLRGNEYYIFNDEKVVRTDKYCNKGAYILCYRQNTKQ